MERTIKERDRLRSACSGRFLSWELGLDSKESLKCAAIERSPFPQ